MFVKTKMYNWIIIEYNQQQINENQKCHQALLIPNTSEPYNYSLNSYAIQKTQFWTWTVKGKFYRFAMDDFQIW